MPLYTIKQSKNRILNKAVYRKFSNRYLKIKIIFRVPE